MRATTSAFIPHIDTANVAAQGECLQADTRLVIAPGAGVFEPTAELSPGAPIRAGQIIGHLRSGEQATPVVSPFTGQAGDALAWRGERLTTHQPVMWLSVDAGRP